MSIALAYHQVLESIDELQELIDGCLQNNRGAQEKMYRLFYPRMQSMVRKYYSDPMQVEEIMNNGFLRAFQKIGSYAFKGSFEGWLRKIFYHAVADYATANNRYTQNIVLEEKEEFVHKDLVSGLYYNDLMQLIETLPSTCRIVFNLFVLEDLTHKEIAKMLSISEGTSKWHLSEARKLLKEKIEKQNLNFKK